VEARTFDLSLNEIRRGAIRIIDRYRSAVISSKARYCIGAATIRGYSRLRETIEGRDNTHFLKRRVSSIGGLFSVCSLSAAASGSGQ